MKLIDNKGVFYSSIREFCKIHGFCKSTVAGAIKRSNKFEKNGKSVWIYNGTVAPPNKAEKDSEYENYKTTRTVDFSFYKIEERDIISGDRYAIALFSDVHLEEKVELDSVLGLNEYNLTIAEERVKNYFRNLVICLKRDKVKLLYFGCLGDIISGFIHEELAQTNSLTPPEAILKAQSLIVSGLKYIITECPNIKIVFIGICGNHSRVTKKIQHNNGFKMSYEWILYNNIKDIASTLNLSIDFMIPRSEIAIIETPDKRRFVMAHGYQIKSSGTGTVCGIYPALQRLALKWEKTFKQDKIYIGHFHSCISIPNAVVNGSIIGVTPFGLSNGFFNEEPAQIYEVYDSEVGLLLTRKIYCN